MESPFDDIPRAKKAIATKEFTESTGAKKKPNLSEPVPRKLLKKVQTKSLVESSEDDFMDFPSKSSSKSASKSPSKSASKSPSKSASKSPSKSTKSPSKSKSSSEDLENIPLRLIKPKRKIKKVEEPEEAEEAEEEEPEEAEEEEPEEPEEEDDEDEIQEIKIREPKKIYKSPKPQKTLEEILEVEEKEPTFMTYKTGTILEDKDKSGPSLVKRKEVPSSGVYIPPIIEKTKERKVFVKPTKEEKKSEIEEPVIKAMKESKLTEEDCDKFIEASDKVKMGESFQNPVTGRMMKKGSASFFNYLKDCDRKMKLEKVTERRIAADKDIQRYGKRKIYDCKDYEVSTSAKFNPNPHQIKARNRFKEIMEDPPLENLRGLLLYYGLGTGKTCTYAMIADLYHQKYPDNPIFIFTPGSLRTNFLEQYCSFCGRNKSSVPNNFVFLTINDSTVLGKLPKNFDNSLVIIDEVHKLTHAKANESPILSNIYDTIEKSNNMYIVTGSGTPIETNLEELMHIANLHIKNLFDMESTFKKMFKWDKDSMKYYPKDESEFNRIFSSFISHYDPQGQLEATGSSAFPKVYKEDVYVPINPDREQEYVFIVQAENERMKKPSEDLKFRDYEKYKKMKQAYYIAISRLVSSQSSNFKYPLLNVEEYKDVEKIKKKKRDEEGGEEGGGEKGEKGEEEQDVALEVEEGIDKLDEEVVGSAQVIGVPDLQKGKGGWVTEETLENLDTNGEKLLEIIEDIKETPGKHAVYTRFKTHFGSRLLGTLLDLEGIPYIYFDGDMNDRERVKVLEKFNSPKNIHGEKVKVIILTSAGSAGINLKEIRRFHILEQYFNLAYMSQVIGRGIRYLSHERLDPKDRNITIRNYFLQLSTPDQTKDFSSDVLAYRSGLQKDKAISQVRSLIKKFDI